MAKIRATKEQCEALYNARTLAISSRKAAKKRIFTEIRTNHGLRGVAKLGIRTIIDPSDTERYGVLYDKKSKKDLDNGVPEPVVAVAVEAPVAPVVKAKVVAAIPVKKEAVKPVKTPTAAPKPAVTVPGSSPTKTAKCTIEVRTTVNGKRVRLGYASSEKAKAAMIAAYKEANS